MPARPIAPDLFRTDGEGPRLLAARCQECHGHQFPAAATCPYCGGRCDTLPVGPDGELRLLTVVHKAPPGYRGPVPYGFGVVRLREVPLEVISRVCGPSLESIAPGTPLRLAIEPLYRDEDGCDVLSWAFTTT